MEDGTSWKMLGVDLGTVRIGVAVSDETGTVCTPRKVILAQGDKNDMLTLARIAEHENATSIVVGIPLSLEGKYGIQAKKARSVMTRLRKFTSLPVVGWDERLTTSQALRLLRENNVKGKDARLKVDSAAAALMLDSYISYLRQAK